ncbi:transposase [Mesorhizobium sp. LjRoot246]|uniref:transposase n=1 Tax=Mesorhizobium sp. LjRoot246 TaxID=3342294 RepID=UPI003F5092DD
MAVGFSKREPWQDIVLQHRVQASGRAGISVGRDAAQLAKRHDITRTLIRVWIGKYEAGGFDEDTASATLITEYEVRIAALERLVGKQALELEFLKGALKSAPRPKSWSSSTSPIRTSMPKARLR